MFFKKKISEIKQPGDAYDVANRLNNLQPGDPGWNDCDAASEAAKLMKDTGWSFLTYNQEGQEIHHPPGSHVTCPDCGGSGWLDTPPGGDWTQCRTCHGIGKISS
jgi:hypothetical protein